MTRAVFVTGTDTGIGKTRIARALLRWGRARGLRTLGLKPLATGAEDTAGGLRNEDALALQELSTVAVPYATVNPYCFREPVAPHLAAARAGVPLAAETIAAHVRACLRLCDFLVVEGVGGLCVPLNAREDLRDLVRVLGFPVVLVVGLRLGCLNHALLTAEALGPADGFWAWVANRVDRAMLEPEGNLATLRGRLEAPFLWEQPHDGPEDDPGDARRVAASGFETWLAGARPGGRDVP